MAYVTPTSTTSNRQRRRSPYSQTTDDIEDQNTRHKVSADSAPIGEPALFHRINAGKSILSLLTTDSKILAGTQDGDLLIWSIRAHRGSVLCLHLSADHEHLFTSAGDAIVNVCKGIVYWFSVANFLGLVHAYA